jgi:hypothetical protein
MKKLYDGTEVSLDTPTKITSLGRVLMTETDTADALAKEAKFITLKDDKQKNKLRQIREPLLMEATFAIFTLEDAGSDTSAWRTYRQALRDITDAPDIYNVTWPTKPV